MGLVLEDLVGLHRTHQLQFFGISAHVKNLDCCYIEWFALETNQDQILIFETIPKYSTSDSSVDYEGYSISSKGFLTIVVDIMVI